MDKLWRRIRKRKKSSKSSLDKNATQNKSPEPDPARNKPELLGNTAKRFDFEDVMRASEPREEDSLGRRMSGTTSTVSKGTEDTSSWLNPSAQVDRHSQLYRSRSSKFSSEKYPTRNKSPEPDPARNELVLLGNPAKRFYYKDVWRASEPREEDSLGKWMSGTTYEVDEEDKTTVILKIFEDVFLSEVQSIIEELCNLGGQRDGDSQPDKVSRGTKDASSSLIPSAQVDRHSQLDQFSQVNNDMYTRKPPDGVLKVSERVYVFDCCLTVDGSNNKDHTILIKGVVDKVQRHFPDAFLKVFNFGEQESQRQMSELLSYMDVMNYPICHGNCPILTMEMIHLFLRSADAWLSCDEQRCMLLVHCERGGWPVLAFMLAALLLYWKKSNGEEEILHSIYEKDPLDLLHLISPLNPLPSQLRYLHYISTSNVDSRGRLPNKAVTLDSVILRFIPCLDAELGCHLMFKIFGQDPHNLTDKTPTVLFSTPERDKDIRHYKQFLLIHSVMRSKQRIK